MTKKEPCKYGAKCYRKNPDHLKDFTHDDSIYESNDDDLNESLSEPNILETTQDKRDNLAEEAIVQSDGLEQKNILLDKVDKIDLSKIKGICFLIFRKICIIILEFFFIDIRELVLEHNQMQMPEDFYELLEFCKFINSNDPKSKRPLN